MLQYVLKKDVNHDQLGSQRMSHWNQLKVIIYIKIIDVLTNHSILGLCYFHSVCSLFPSSPAALTLLNSELWHQVKAFGSAALLWRTDCPCRSPAARTLAAQLRDRCRWPALLPSLLCLCICAFCVVVACVSLISAWPSLLKVLQVYTNVISVLGEKTSLRSVWFHFSLFLFFVYSSYI